MKLLFAAGDIGGARALLPVARLAAAEGDIVTALAHGVFHAEGSPDWHWLTPAEAAKQVKLADAVLYATSVFDELAVEIAMQARTAGRPVLHLLDNWSNYAIRITKLVPDVYAVMDNLALEEAIAAGVPREIISVSGHPDLAKIKQERRAFRSQSAGDLQQSLFFVSEPAAVDSGQVGRGYDETNVARALVEGLALAGARKRGLTLHVAPHPRENRAAVHARFEILSADFPSAPPFVIITPDEVRRTLHMSSHVVGMSSILLYEAWLLGRPTLSLQPGLVGPGLRSLSQRGGVMFHSARQGTAAAVAKWLAQRPREPEPNLEQHANAARTVLDMARDLAVKDS